MSLPPHADLDGPLGNLIAEAGPQNVFFWAADDPGRMPDEGSGMDEMTQRVPGGLATPTAPSGSAQPVWTGQSAEFLGDDQLISNYQLKIEPSFEITFWGVLSSVRCEQNPSQTLIGAASDLPRAFLNCYPFNGTSLRMEIASTNFSSFVRPQVTPSNLDATCGVVGSGRIEPDGFMKSHVTYVSDSETLQDTETNSGFDESVTNQLAISGSQANSRFLRDKQISSVGSASVYIDTKQSLNLATYLYTQYAPALQ